MGDQPLAHRSGRDRHDDVVDREAPGVLDRLDVVEREATEGEAPVWGESLVERGLGRDEVQRLGQCRLAQDGAGARSGGPAHQSRAGQGAERSLADVCDRGRQRARGSQRVASKAEQAPPDHLQVTGRRRRLGGRGRLAALGFDIEHQAQDLGPGHPVDQGVVDFAHHRHLARAVALDHVELPQRAGAIEWTRVQAGDLSRELPVGARRGQGDLADVVLEVERAVLDPVRVIEPERDLAQAPAHRGRSGSRSARRRRTSRTRTSPPGAVEGSSITRPPTWPVCRSFSRARNCMSRLVSCRIALSPVIHLTSWPTPV